MRRRSEMYPENAATQRGFSLPIAIFMLIIMAMIALHLTRLSSVSNLSAAQEELSNRAFYAAESGASWAMASLYYNPGGTADKAFSDAGCAAVGGASTLTYNQPGLYTCSAQVSCVAQTVNLNGYYRIQSTGRCGTGQAQTVRTIEVGAKNEP